MYQGYGSVEADRQLQRGYSASSAHGQSKPVLRKEDYLRLWKLNCRVGDNHILRDLSFTLCAGEIVGIVGDEDSGLPHLGRILSGETPFSDGRLYCGDQRMNEWQRNIAEEKHILRIHPGSRLVEGMNVAENLCMVRSPGQVPGSERRLVKERHLHLLAAEYLIARNWKLDTHRYPEGLTEAEKLKILIIRAEMCHCRLLILDQVCGAAMGEDHEQMRRILSYLKKQGIGVVVLERRPDLIVNCTDRVMVLRHGQLQGDYYTDEYSPNTIRTLLTGESGHREGGYFPGTAAGTGRRYSPGMDKVTEGTNGRGRQLRLYRRPVRRKKTNSAPEELLLQQGEILGISAPGWDWLSFREYFPEVMLENGTRGELRILLGEQDNFGLHETWSCCENVSQGSFPRLRGHLGWLPGHLMRFCYRESGLAAAQMNELPENLNTTERLHLALENCRLSRPSVILMAGISQNMDMLHMEELIRELGRLSDSGITVVLLNPPFSMIRGSCHRLLVWEKKMSGRRGQTESPKCLREFGDSDIHSGALGVYFYGG